MNTCSIILCGWIFKLVTYITMHVVSKKPWMYIFSLLVVIGKPWLNDFITSISFIQMVKNLPVRKELIYRKSELFAIGNPIWAESIFFSFVHSHDFHCEWRSEFLGGLYNNNRSRQLTYNRLFMCESLHNILQMY